MSSFRQCNGTENSFVNFHNLLLKQAVAKLNNETKDNDVIILDLYASFMSVFMKKGDRPGDYTYNIYIHFSNNSTFSLLLMEQYLRFVQEVQGLRTH
jgi:hypothetical protein